MNYTEVTVVRGCRCMLLPLQRRDRSLIRACFRNSETYCSPLYGMGGIKLRVLKRKQCSISRAEGSRIF
jgi:hypothetical protein